MNKILEGVEELCEGMEVFLTFGDRTCVMAWNEDGHNCTLVDAQQLFDALKAEGFK